MKILCSLWLCLGGNGHGTDAEQVVSACAAKETDIVLVADGDVEVKRTDGTKSRCSTSNKAEDEDALAGQIDCVGGSKGCEAGAGKSPAATEEAVARDQHSFLAGDLHNERTLRALLQKAKARLSEQTQAFSVELQALETDSARPALAADPELGRINAQLLEACKLPKPDVRSLLRVELLLGELHRWLAVRRSPAAATAVLYAVGDGLVHAEHAVRSVGLVRYWQPDHTTVFVALLQLYADLLLQATRVAELHRQQQDSEQRKVLMREKGEEQQPANQRSSSSCDVVVPGPDQKQQQQDQQNGQQPTQQLLMQQRRLVTEKLMPHLSDMAMSLEYDEQGGSVPRRGNLPKPQPQSQPPPPLTFAAAALLLRPDWLDMMAEVLDLLHFNNEYRLAAVRAGLEPQEALAKALQLWCFLTQLVKFAAAHADSVQRMEPCLQRLAALLTPPSGTVPRLLELPLAEDTLVAQLHALWLLQVLYDMPDAKVLYSPALADYYVALHHNAMVQSYEASAADPKSAAAELCRIHATLLRSMARHPGAPVRSAFARAKTVEWILQELALEGQFLAAAQQGGEVDDADSDSDSSVNDDEDSDITVSDDEGEGDAGGDGVDPRRGSSSEEAAQPVGRRPLSPAAVTKTTAGAAEGLPPEGGERRAVPASRMASKAFSFTYDLNEDVERLIALEDEMGEEMELEGFEYDEEGMQLKARSDARLAEALAVEAAAAAAAATAVQAGLPPAADATQEHPQPIQQQQRISGSRELCSCNSSGGNSRHSSGVPRLPLASLRAASISSLTAASPAGGKRSSGQGGRSSYTGNGTLRVLSAHAEDGDGACAAGASSSSLSDDEARTPSPDAAAAAKRVAEWSSSLMEAYAAASAGDVSKLPYPPQRNRSRTSGRLGELAPADVAAASEEHLQEQPAGPPVLQQHRQSVSADGATAEGASQASPVRPRELTNGSPVHPGPHGELHIMVQSSGTTRASQAMSTASSSAHGRPPLPTKPALPPLKMGTGTSFESAAAAAAAPPPSTLTSPKPIISARGTPLGGSRAMVVLSASNRAQQGTASPVRPQLHGTNEGSSTPPRPVQPLIPALNLNSLRRRVGDGGSFAAAPTDTGRTVPLSCMLRTTNAGSLSNCSGMDSANTVLRSNGTTTTPASSAHTATHPGAGHVSSQMGMLRRITETEQLPPEVAYQEVACQRLLYMDRTTHILLLKVLVDLLVTPSGTLDPGYVPQFPAHSGVPHAEYTLLWHLNAPRNSSVVHDLCRGAQRRAQQAAAAAARRAAEAAAAVAAAAAAAALPRSGSSSPLPQTYSTLQQLQQQQQRMDSARDHVTTPDSAAMGTVGTMMGTAFGSALAASVALVATPTRAGAVTRVLQLLSRPLFDASRYTNLQFVARGTFGDIYRARMAPPRAQAWVSLATSVQAMAPEGAAAAGPGEATAAAAPPAPMQVVIKTIQLPGSPHDACVLADVFGEISVMERFMGHDCICQLIDYGMRDDAYWLVMRRYRCSLAEWRGRQKPLADLIVSDSSGGGDGDGSGTSDGSGRGSRCASATATVAAAARVYLSALLQVIDALRLLAAHHVVHFDLKCSNVLIEPLPGVRDGELWGSVGRRAAASSHGVPFRCVLADFGEARAYRSAEEAFTARNRGTEVFKSPEMLLLNAAGHTSGKPAPPADAASSPLPPSSSAAALTLARPRQQNQPPSRASSGASSPAATARTAATITNTPPRPTTADAKRKSLFSGAGLASDVWSLGCLAYELLSGTVLFGGDYASVTHRVAFGSGNQLSLTEAERGRLGNQPALVDLVEWILVRDPARRPSLDRIRERVEHVRTALSSMC